MVWIDATKGLPKINDKDERSLNLKYSLRVIVSVFHENGKFESLSFGRYSYEANEWLIEGFGGTWNVSHWAYQINPVTKQIIVE